MSGSLHQVCEHCSRLQWTAESDERELDLSVDTTRPDERRVERFDLVRGHDDLDVTARVEAVQLIEQFQHGALDLALSARCRIVTLRADCINLVDENDRRGHLLCRSEQLSHELRTVSEVLLDQLAADDSKEGCGCLICHSLREQSLARTRDAIQNDACEALRVSL